MKRNLLKGIVLIGAVALSSCSTLNQLSKTSYTGDDVYFTKAQAGDSFDYTAAYAQTQPVIRNDDYYYYGDYASRINRFSYSSPFAYDDDFYYGNNPYYYDSYNYGYGPSTAPVYNFNYSPVYDLGVYSAFDFGYGNYWGFDNYGFGYAFSNFIYSGGISKRNRIKTYTQAGGYPGTGATAGSGLAFTRGGTGASAANALANGLSFTRGANAAYPNSRPVSAGSVYPGRPANVAAQTQQNNTANRNLPPTIRPMSENPRPYSPPVIERSSPPPSQSSGGGSSGSSSSSGGGGRPVRP